MYSVLSAYQHLLLVKGGIKVTTLPIKDYAPYIPIVGKTFKTLNEATQFFNELIIEEIEKEKREIKNPVGGDGVSL